MLSLNDIPSICSLLPDVEGLECQQMSRPHAVAVSPSGESHDGTGFAGCGL